ncbi:MAG: hypothetical protein K0R40_1660 [Burkholderiales bacterium]|nr:hypothetical protein [Burkholderiales bacterium]
MAMRRRFVDALKRSLRARGLTYGALARELRLSEASVKRMFSRGTFTLSRIEQILAVLDLELDELARMSRSAEAQARELSLEQESALAKDERLLSVFWLLQNDWRFAEVKVAKDFAWRPGGPVKKVYGRRVMQEFLHGRFEAPLELLRFESRVLSPESAMVLKRRLERLARDFNEFAEADASAPSARKVSVALLAACRPWEFSVVNALKRRRSV